MKMKFLLVWIMFFALCAPLHAQDETGGEAEDTESTEGEGGEEAAPKYTPKEMEAPDISGPEIKLQLERLKVDTAMVGRLSGKALEDRYDELTKLIVKASYLPRYHKNYNSVMIPVKALSNNDPTKHNQRAPRYEGLNKVKWNSPEDSLTYLELSDLAFEARKSRALLENKMREHKYQKVNSLRKHVDSLSADAFVDDAGNIKNTKLLDQLKEIIFEGKQAPNVQSFSLGSVVPDAKKYGLNPRQGVVGFRLPLGPEHHLLILDLQTDGKQSFIWSVAEGKSLGKH